MVSMAASSPVSRTHHTLIPLKSTCGCLRNHTLCTKPFLQRQKSYKGKSIKIWYHCLCQTCSKSLQTFTGMNVWHHGLHEPSATKTHWNPTLHLWMAKPSAAAQCSKWPSKDKIIVKALVFGGWLKSRDPKTGKNRWNSMSPQSP